MSDRKCGLFFLYLANQVCDRHYVTPRFVRGKITYQKYAETIKDFGVGAGKSGDILQINMRVVNLYILVSLEIKGVARCV